MLDQSTYSAVAGSTLVRFFHGALIPGSTRCVVNRKAVCCGPASLWCTRPGPDGASGPISAHGGTDLAAAADAGLAEFTHQALHCGARHLVPFVLQLLRPGWRVPGDQGGGRRIAVAWPSGP